MLRAYALPEAIPFVAVHLHAWHIGSASNNFSTLVNRQPWYVPTKLCRFPTVTPMNHFAGYALSASTSLDVTYELKPTQCQPRATARDVSSKHICGAAKRMPFSHHEPRRLLSCEPPFAALDRVYTTHLRQTTIVSHGLSTRPPDNTASELALGD